MTRLTRPSASVTWILLMLLAAPVHAQHLDDYVLYGVDGAGEHLYRYGFREKNGAGIGILRHADTGQTLAGIKALAYVPGHQNLFAFWNDPGDNKTKLVYVSLADATAQIYSNDFGNGAITAATAAKSYVGRTLTPNPCHRTTWSG